MSERPPTLHFENSIQSLDEWGRRANIPLTTADALGAPYARANRWLNALRSQLVRDYNWSDAPSSDNRILFAIEASSIWRSSVGLAAGPKLRLCLPVHASSFFSPERRVQWEMVFHSDTFESVRKICPPITDILHLLQCLLPGLLTIVLEERLPQGIYRTTRGLPPVSWINANEASLVDVFGSSHFRALRKACADTKVAFKLEIVAR